MASSRELLKKARIAALAAGEAIMEIYRSDQFEEELKTDRSPVTKADRAAHNIISRHLAGTNLPILSEEGGDVSSQERNRWQKFWLVDPLDGTTEFLKKNGEFTVNIALIEGRKAVMGVVYAPGLDLMYAGCAETGIIKVDNGDQTIIAPLRQPVKFDDLLAKETVTVIASRSHLSEETSKFISQFKNVKLEVSGSSLKFMALAENKADIYPRLSPTMEWDTAAAHAILAVAGRSIFQTDLRTELTYNKPNLVNPFFIAF